MWILSMKFDSCRLSGAYSFESASIFLDKLYTFLYSTQHLTPKTEFSSLVFPNKHLRKLPISVSISFYELINLKMCDDEITLSIFSMCNFLYHVNIFSSFDPSIPLTTYPICNIPSGCEIKFYSKTGKIEPSIS